MKCFSGSGGPKLRCSGQALESRLDHFDLFHARHATGFGLDTLLWLRDGINPWPGKRFDS
ncbi:hypothetical protein [Rhizobium sp. LjRoot254]|uniref:hypothetical protein n=1 Tax=Rhizobium sp. LjRoot254 TaxID=3342297 RepID=UPI003F4FA2E9